MNRYPLWKYAILLVALVVGMLYTLPNFFGEAPAVQVSSGKVTLKIDAAMAERVEGILKNAGVTPDFVQFDGNSVKARLSDVDTQVRAKDALVKALNPDPANPSYIVALNLLSRSPAWMAEIRALPMYLGLDLRGGVHFLMQVDMKAALDKRAESLAGDIRTMLRDKNIRHGGLSRDGQALELRFRDAATRTQALDVLSAQLPELAWTEAGDGEQLRLTGRLTEVAARAVQDQALKQNITTLHNRVNELGVAEPVIQQQGADRVVVQLPGVQDTAKAKDIIGRTATLEIRMVDESAAARDAERGAGPVPFGSERFPERNGTPLIVKRDVVLTGENLTDAQPGFDQRFNRPVVNFRFDTRGAKKFADVTAANVGKPFAIVLDGKVVTAPRINEPILGGSGQISGSFSVQETQDLALVLRAGALPAPLVILEERTVGPGLGADSVAAGKIASVVGLVAVIVFMVVTYGRFGIYADIALLLNVVLIGAALSGLQATLTLPGIAGIVLTIGMAVDANVLVFERIREETRAGRTPISAIDAGYSRALKTIIDANVTTLIAAVLLYSFGSGPVRGFAVTLAIGIVTSMFTAIMVTRLMVVTWLRRTRPSTLPV